MDQRGIVRISSTAKRLDPFLISWRVLDAAKLPAPFVLSDALKFVVGLHADQLFVTLGDAL